MVLVLSLFKLVKARADALLQRLHACTANSPDPSGALTAKGEARGMESETPGFETCSDGLRSGIPGILRQFFRAWLARFERFLELVYLRT